MKLEKKDYYTLRGDTMLIDIKPTIGMYGVHIEVDKPLSIIIGDSAVGKSYLSKIVDKHYLQGRSLIISKPADLEMLNIRKNVDIAILDNYEVYFSNIRDLSEVYAQLKSRSNHVIILAHDNWRFDLLGDEYDVRMLEVDRQNRIIYATDLEDDSF